MFSIIKKNIDLYKLRQKYTDLSNIVFLKLMDEYKQVINVLDNKGKYRFGTLDVGTGKNMPDVRLTVDTQEDYDRACYILEKAGKKYVTTETAIALAMEFDRNIKSKRKD